jgi:hypothetical protein
MPEEVMVMNIVMTAILCGTGVGVYALKLIFGGKGHAKDEALLKEIRDMRAEMLALRRENNDVVLALDSTVSRLDQRLTHVETRGQLGAGPTSRSESEAVEILAQRR